MVVLWSDFAKSNLKDFVKTTLMTDKNSAKYVTSLVEYVSYLDEQHFLGKVLTTSKNNKIYQLIYKQHRILYSIGKNEILVVAVVHTAQNLENTLKNIKKFFA